MLINLYTLIRNLLITFTRDIKMVELIRVLTSEVETAHNTFMLQVPDWNYTINANASAISLQHQIKRELDVDAVITELDGKPIDFLVTVTGFVDESKLSNLINAYKLSGRSFIFENSELTYYCSFINHLCEKSLIDNLISMTIPQGTGSIEVESQFAVATNVVVTIREWAIVGKEDTITVTIFAGTTISDIGQNNQARPYQQIVSISVDADETYRYSFDNTVING